MYTKSLLKPLMISSILSLQLLSTVVTAGPDYGSTAYDSKSFDALKVVRHRDMGKEDQRNFYTCHRRQYMKVIRKNERSDRDNDYKEIFYDALHFCYGKI